MSNNPLKTIEARILAAAALQDIISQGNALQASATRSDPSPAAEGIRGRAHDILDFYLDQMSAAGAEARAHLKG